jgi:hypothetical protein
LVAGWSGGVKPGSSFTAKAWLLGPDPCTREGSI